jgi:hypothetical protein
MIGVQKGVILYAFRTQKLQADPLSTKVGDGLIAMLRAGDIIVEIGLHVLNCECFLHFY